MEAAAAVHALEHGSTCRDGRSIVRLVAVGDCESEGEQTLRPAVSARQDPNILPCASRRVLSLEATQRHGHGPASISQDRWVDARTKLLIAGMVLFVLVCLVIGGILAIASPPSSCC